MQSLINDSKMMSLKTNKAWLDFVSFPLWPIKSFQTSCLSAGSLQLWRGLHTVAAAVLRELQQVLLPPLPTI